MKDLYSMTEHNYIVEEGEIDDFKYCIISTGDHPCAYVGMKGLFEKYGYDRLYENVEVHGGITFDSETSWVTKLDENLEWVGWDYAHVGDYLACMSRHLEWYKDDLKEARKYTYEEIMSDIKKVVDFLRNI